VCVCVCVCDVRDAACSRVRALRIDGKLQDREKKQRCASLLRSERVAMMRY